MFNFLWQNHPGRRNRTGVLLTLLILAACTPAPKRLSDTAPELIYPPPPAKPRFVFERSLRFDDNVLILSAGERLKRVLTGIKEVRGLVKPYDVAAYHGQIYVTDTVQSAVIVFDIPGGRYRQFGQHEPGTLGKPLGIDVSPEGEVFVVDGASRHVKVYALDGTFRRTVGSPQTLTRPTDVAVDLTSDKLYIVDTGGIDTREHRLRVFNRHTGRFMQAIGERGREKGQFNLPLHAVVDLQGRVWVVDSGNFRVQQFSPDGRPGITFGSLGRYPGQFARPKGIAADPAGNLYVVDTAFGNFQIFNPEGELLLFIGQRGQAGKPGIYMLPSGIDVDLDGRIYVVDQFFRKVDVYRPWELEPAAGFR